MATMRVVFSCELNIIGIGGNDTTVGRIEKGYGGGGFEGAEG